MTKLTKKAKKEFLRDMLGNNAAWAKQALLRVYDLQTDDEKSSKTTTYDNGVGFTGVDGEILSSFAQQLEKWNRLSEKQMAIVFKKMPKYWRQILDASDPVKLESAMIKAQEINTNRALHNFKFSN